MLGYIHLLACKPRALWREGPVQASAVLGGLEQAGVGCHTRDDLAEPQLIRIHRSRDLGLRMQPMTKSA